MKKRSSRSVLLNLQKSVVGTKYVVITLTTLALLLTSCVSGHITCSLYFSIVEMINHKPWSDGENELHNPHKKPLGLVSGIWQVLNTCLI